MNRPDRPLADEEDRDQREHHAVDDDDRHADVGEREAGANVEQVTDHGNLRDDPTPPGQDPDDPEVAEAHDEGA